MKCQTYFLGKQEKIIINLSSAEYAQSESRFLILTRLMTWVWLRLKSLVILFANECTDLEVSICFLFLISLKDRHFYDKAFVAIRISNLQLYGVPFGFKRI